MIKKIVVISIGVIIAIVGAILLYGAFRTWQAFEKNKTVLQQAQAVTIATYDTTYNPQKDIKYIRYWHRLQFDTKAGKPIEVLTERAAEKKYKKGQQVVVYYHPDRPETEYYLENLDAFKSAITSTSLLGTFVLVIGIATAWFGVRTKFNEQEMP